MQRLCHQHRAKKTVSVVLNIATIWGVAAAIWPAIAGGEAPKHDYPTTARVEYVNECIANQRDSLANVYQCSCVIDRIANQLSYDDFVEAITFARYSGLPGEAGGIFRDSDEGRKLAKRFRDLEADAYRACGLTK
jgi:hypothetical protein